MMLSFCLEERSKPVLHIESAWITSRVNLVLKEMVFDLTSLENPESEKQGRSHSEDASRRSNGQVLRKRNLDTRGDQDRDAERDSSSSKKSRSMPIDSTLPTVKANPTSNSKGEADDPSSLETQDTFSQPVADSQEVAALAKEMKRQAEEKRKKQSESAGRTAT